MTRAEYEAARTLFRCLFRLRREVPLSPLHRLPKAAREYARLMLPVEVRGDPLSVPISRRLAWFKRDRYDVAF